MQTGFWLLLLSLYTNILNVSLACDYYTVIDVGIDVDVVVVYLRCFLIKCATYVLVVHTFLLCDFQDLLDLLRSVFLFWGDGWSGSEPEIRGRFRNDTFPSLTLTSSIQGEFCRFGDRSVGYVCSSEFLHSGGFQVWSIIVLLIFDLWFINNEIS